jgi:hypothetical protein
MANAEVNLNFAQHSGDTVVANVGTSAVETLTKLMLMLDCESAVDYGGDDLVIGSAFQPANPIVIRRTPATNLFPFGSGPTVAPYVGVMSACIVTAGDFYRLLDGQLAPIAGWEPKYWGDDSDDGVVIVPMYTSWSNDPRNNWNWTKGHTEYPMNIYTINGTLVDPAGIALIGGTNGVAASARVAVAGGRYKILYVMVDRFNDQVTTVNVGLPGAVVAVAPANYVIGGVAVDITPIAVAELALVGGDAVATYNSIARWKMMFGNDDDWENATLLASEFYAYNKLKPRKVDNVVELNYWNNENADPFVPAGAWAFRRPLVADITNAVANLTSASGCRMLSEVDVRTMGGSWTMRKLDPAIYVAIAAKMIRYMTPMRNDILTIGALSSSHAIKSMQMALATDMYAQKLSISERSFISMAERVNGNNAYNLWRLFTAKYEESVFAHINVKTCKPLWADNTDPNAGYAASLPVSQFTAVLSRVNPWWVQFLIKQQVGPLVDAMSFSKYVWNVVEVGANNADQLVDMGIVEWVKDSEKELTMRKFQCSGSLILSAADYSDVWLTNKNGAFPLHMSFPFDSPTDGYNFNMKYVTFRDIRDKGDLIDLNFATLPMTVDTENGMQKKYLAIVGQRALFCVDTEMIPLLVSKETFGYIIGDQGRSVGSFGKQAFTEMESFRF